MPRFRESGPEGGGGRVQWVERSAHGLSGLPRVVDHRDPAGRAGERVGCEVAGTDAVRHPVVRRPRHGRIRAEQRARPASGARSVIPVNVPAAERDRRANRFPWRLGNDVDGAGHGVRAPHRGRRPPHHLDLLHVVEVGREQVPQDEAEEVEVGAATVHQNELRVRQRVAGAAAGDLHVARRELNHIEARRRTQEVAVVLGRRGFKRGGRDDRRRHRRIDQPVLVARGGHDHRVAEARELQLDRRQRERRAGDRHVLDRRVGEPGERHAQRIGAGGDPGQLEGALLVRVGGARDPVATQCHGGARQHQGGLVDNVAGDASCLRRPGRRPQEDQQETPCAGVTNHDTGISVLPAQDSPCIHPRAAEPRTAAAVAILRLLD